MMSAIVTYLRSLLPLSARPPISSSACPTTCLIGPPALAPWSSHLLCEPSLSPQKLLCRLLVLPVFLLLPKAVRRCHLSFQCYLTVHQSPPDAHYLCTYCFCPHCRRLHAIPAPPPVLPPDQLLFYPTARPLPPHGLVFSARRFRLYDKVCNLALVRDWFTNGFRTFDKLFYNRNSIRSCEWSHGNREDVRSAVFRARSEVRAF